MLLQTKSSSAVASRLRYGRCRDIAANRRSLRPAHPIPHHPPPFTKPSSVPNPSSTALAANLPTPPPRRVPTGDGRSNPPALGRQITSPFLNPPSKQNTGLTCIFDTWGGWVQQQQQQLQAGRRIGIPSRLPCLWRINLPCPLRSESAQYALCTACLFPCVDSCRCCVCVQRPFAAPAWRLSAMCLSCVPCSLYMHPSIALYGSCCVPPSPLHHAPQLPLPHAQVVCTKLLDWPPCGPESEGVVSICIVLACSFWAGGRGLVRGGRCLWPRCAHGRSLAGGAGPNWQWPMDGTSRLMGLPSSFG